MEGIKKDILIANKLTRIQKQIDALTPADCDELCNTLIEAEVALKEAESAEKTASELRAEAETALEVAQETETAAETSLAETIQNRAECIAGCEPLPVGQECVDECNNEFNVTEAEDALDAAIAATNAASAALSVANENYNIAQAALEAADAAVEAAKEAATAGECECS